MFPWKDKRFLGSLLVAVSLHAAVLVPLLGKIEEGGRSKISTKPLQLALRFDTQPDEKAAMSLSLASSAASQNSAGAEANLELSAVREQLRSLELGSDNKANSKAIVSKEPLMSKIESGPVDRVESCVQATELPTNEDGTVDKRSLGGRILCEQG